MLDVAAAPDDIEIVPARKLEGRVSAVLVARGKDFVTEAAAALSLGFDGIEDDVHAGPTRRSGSREPWYPRNTEMRNERQLSIVAADELAHRRLAHGHCRDQAGVDRRQSGHRRRAAAVDAAGRHAAVLRQWRHRQGRRAERAVPDRRQIHRRARRHGRCRRPERCCFPRPPSACAGWSAGSRSRARSRPGKKSRCGCRSSGSIGADRPGSPADTFRPSCATSDYSLAVLRVALRHVGDVVPLLPGGDAVGVFLLDHRQPDIAEEHPERRLGGIDERQHRRSGRRRIARHDVAAASLHPVARTLVGGERFGELGRWSGPVG